MHYKNRVAQPGIGEASRGSRGLDDARSNWSPSLLFGDWVVEATERGGIAVEMAGHARPTRLPNLPSGVLAELADDRVLRSGQIDHLGLEGTAHEAETGTQPRTLH